MGFFDIFKRKKQSNPLDEMLGKVFSQAFPGGYEQLQNLINEQYLLFNQKYSKDTLTQAINYIATGLIIFKEKSASRIVDMGLMPKKLLSYDDALKLYKAVARNHFESRFGTTSEAAFNAFYQELGNIEGEQCGDVMQGAYGEWGLETSNPIPINGVVNLKNPLRRRNIWAAGRKNRPGACFLGT